MTNTPANRSTAAAPNASPPPGSASCCTHSSGAAPGQAAPHRPTGVRSTTSMTGSPTTASRTSPTSPCPAAPTTASSKTAAGPPANATTAAPNGYHHHTSTPDSHESTTFIIPRSTWLIETMRTLSRRRCPRRLSAELGVVRHPNRAEHILGRHIEGQRPTRYPHQDVLGQRVFVVQRQMACATLVDLGDVHVEHKAGRGELGLDGARLRRIPALIDSAARQLRHRRQRGQHPLIGQHDRADVTRYTACRPITGDPTAEPARDRHVFGEVNDSLGLDLCAHLVRQLADPQQLSQKDSHVQ